MEIVIVGGGNMGGAIAHGLVRSQFVEAQSITVINKSTVRSYGDQVKSVVNDYSSLKNADIVIIAIKPWSVEYLMRQQDDSLRNKNQILISVAAGVSLDDLQKWSPVEKPIFRAMPNTAIAQKQSMTFICSANASDKQKELVGNIFAELGKVEMIDEKLFAAATSLSGCGIAYVFRYIRASMLAGVEMGIPSDMALETTLQTLRGAVELLEATGNHPEVEIDKVTTPGGITIKGLNELEHSGFTSAIVKALKASKIE